MIPLAIKACGMVTAVGFNSASSCAAIRAGVSGVKEANLWDASTGEYIQAGRPETLQWWEGADMLAELSAPAIVECLSSLPKDVAPYTVPIFVLLSPTDRPLREDNLEYIVLNELEHRLNYKLMTGSSAYSSGRTGIIAALETASDLLTRKVSTHAVVVGVDTFLRQKVVETYLHQRRVLTADNSNGFIPGEAACAVLLAPSGSSNEGELRIIGWGKGHESGTIDSDTPPKGDGLTKAIRQALKLSGINMADTDYWLTDQNAEHHKVKECTIAKIRLERRDEPAPKPYEIWHPIEFLGEIGSAIAPCLLGLGLTAAQKGYAPGPLALMSVGEDNGERAALVLKWQDGR